MATTFVNTFALPSRVLQGAPSRASSFHQKTKGQTLSWREADSKAHKNGNLRTVYTVRQNDKDQFGDFKNGSRWRGDTQYRGEWQSDQREGFGTMIYPSGDRYEGDWVQGKRHGNGAYWVKEGGKLRRQYAGEWRDGKKSGQGVFFYKDGARYEGEWKNDMLHGQGKFFFINGDVYKGDWRDGKRTGVGAMRYLNGNLYEGSWLNDKREGPGKYFYKATMKIHVGEWVNDQPKCGTYLDISPDEYHNMIQDSEQVSVAFTPTPPATPLDRSSAANRITLPELTVLNSEEMIQERVDSIHREESVNRTMALPLSELLTDEDLETINSIFMNSPAVFESRLPLSQLSILLEDLDIFPAPTTLTQTVERMQFQSLESIDFQQFARVVAVLALEEEEEEQAQLESADNSTGLQPVNDD
eukprot:GILK01000887.1.p1 GENE.GILK01000887.1~~GILK01000887.1.p1  ORF type:complete len:414 (+),score=74.17 GILK01000887.1:44-1285(+)